MNIAFAPDAYLPTIGGVEMLVNKLSKEFIKKGHSVNIITLRCSLNLRPFEIMDGVCVNRLYFPFWLWREEINFIYLAFLAPFVILRLWKSMKKYKPDVVNVQCIGLNASYILFLSYFYKFKVVVFMQYFGIISSLPKKITGISNKILLKRADYVTSCSQRLLDAVQRYVPEIKNKSTVIPNGFDPEEFKTVSKYSYARPYIFSLGRFCKIHKGFDILIMAFKSVVDKGYDVDLIIAGYGPEREDYELLVNLLRLKDRIKFLEGVDRGDIVRLFNGCEFFVLPSRNDACPLVNLEAMAAGKAIVATNVNGVPEIIKDGINGILVRAQDDKALADGLIRLLNDSELRNKLGENGKRIVKDYEWEKIANMYLEIYQRILENN